MQEPMKKLADLYRVDNFIDTFALGHYARVLEAQDRRNGQTVAFKVMRPEHLPPTANRAGNTAPSPTKPTC